MLFEIGSWQASAAIAGITASIWLIAALKGHLLRDGSYWCSGLLAAALIVEGTMTYYAGQPPLTISGLILHIVLAARGIISVLARNKLLNNRFSKPTHPL